MKSQTAKDKTAHATKIHWRVRRFILNQQNCILFFKLNQSGVQLVDSAAVGADAGSLSASKCLMTTATDNPSNSAMDNLKRSCEWNCNSGSKSALAMHRKVPVQNASAQPSKTPLESANWLAPK